MLTKIKHQLVKILQKFIDKQEDILFNLLEYPKNISFGHISFPVFFLAKEFKKNPIKIAEDLCNKVNAEQVSFIDKVNFINGYVNFYISANYLQNLVCEKIIFSDVDKIGFSNFGENKKIVIDYSSPNVAKPMNIGHLRATVIGQAIKNLAVTQGYQTIGINHLGDWGVQFGKLVWAYKNWSEEYSFSNPIDDLLKLYVRFHEEAEKNPKLDEEGSLIFKKIEENDSDTLKIWEKFVDLSLKEYQRQWDLLGVRHDLVRGESYFNDKLENVINMLEEKKILVDSEGAKVVFLDEDLPPCLIKKTDGASLYATRDIASAICRKEEFDFDLNLYVVGSEQTLYFKQLFQVLNKMGFEWAKKCKHISFGIYRFKDWGKMSTRKGKIILLEEVLNKAINMVLNIIEKKNPNLQNKKTIARQIGVGAVIFNDLVNDRLKNVDFDWDRILNFEGDSGPYVQYMAVRCQSILKKYNRNLPLKMTIHLDNNEEQILINLLLRYQDILSNSFFQFKPNILAQYLLDLCQAFSTFYHKHRILNSPPEIESSRILLVEACKRVIISGLKVLNIESPKEM